MNNCISEINNTQIDNAKDIEIVMPMHKIIKYSDNSSKTSGSFWHYYKDKPFSDNRTIAAFSANNNDSASFKFKTKIVGRTGNEGTKIVKIRVPLRYLSNSWRNLKIPLINCENNFVLTWSDRCFVIDNPINDQVPTFTITDTKLYVPVATLLIQDNARLLEQLKSGFKRTINWNRYEPKVKAERQNQYLDFLINPIFQGVNRIFCFMI